jgi:hypothetical protein
VGVYVCLEAGLKADIAEDEVRIERSVLTQEETLRVRREIFSWPGKGHSAACSKSSR